MAKCLFGCKIQIIAKMYNVKLCKGYNMPIPFVLAIYLDSTNSLQTVFLYPLAAIPPCRTACFRLSNGLF